MAERRENSVLFSLSELRKIEEDRIRQEDDQRKAAAEAVRQQQIEAERRAREEEERKRREADEFAMRERLEKERLAHEANHKIQEVERRAKVEADARIREQQMHLEMQMKHKAPPVKAIVTVVGILFLVVCGLGYYMWSSHEAEKAVLVKQRQEAEIAQRAAEQQAKELQKQIASIEAEQSQLEAQLKEAKTDAQRAEIQRKMEANKSRVKSLKESSTSGPAKQQVHIGGGDSTDPLQGIK